MIKIGLNIFNIWEEIGKQMPWSNKGIYVIVDKVEPDGKGYE